MPTTGDVLATPANGAGDWTTWITKQDYALRGYMALSLTEYSTSTVPQIAAGSQVEVNGSFCQFAADTDITDISTVADGTVYIKMVVSSTTVTPTATATAPTWSDAKQGWYTGSDRIVARLTKAAPNYTNKAIMLQTPAKQQAGAVTIEDNLTVNGSGGLIVKSGEPLTLDGIALRVKQISIGDWNMDSTEFVTIAHGLADTAKIFAVCVLVVGDSDYLGGNFWRELIEPGGSGWYIQGANIILARVAAGGFDSANYNATSYNRGYINVLYFE